MSGSSRDPDKRSVPSGGEPLFRPDSSYETRGEGETGGGGPFPEDLQGVLSGLSPDPAHLEMAVLSFYRLLLDSEEGRLILESLTPEEFDHLKTRQAAYLGRLLSSDLHLSEHIAMAREVGLRHWAYGIPLSLLAQGAELYERALKVALAGLPEGRSAIVSEILTRRIQTDMSVQTAVYEEMERKRAELLESLERTIAQGGEEEPVLASLLPTLLDPQVGGLLMVDPLPGEFRLLARAGMVPGTDESTFLAWLEGVLGELLLEKIPELCLSLRQDASHPQEILAGFSEAGILSLGAFPVADRVGRPQKILLFFGKTPLVFSPARNVEHWRRVSLHLGEVLARLEDSRFHASPPASATGQEFRRLLLGGALVMQYQPIVDPITGRIVKVEALARLRDGDRLLSPGEFLPAFGQRQLRMLFDQGLSRVVSDLEIPGFEAPPCQLNLPTEILEDLDWLGSLPDRLADREISPRRIGFEILESALVDDPRILRGLHALKERGYSLLLDDVGSGESSLLRMVTLPVDGIKIDQAFVRPLARGFSNLDMIFSLMMLALQRGLSCVAEGVETPGIVDALGSVRNILLQGYAIARPMSAEELSLWTPPPASGVGGPYPHSLFGWYSRHISRLFGVFNALNTISDVIDSRRLEDGMQCPLHAMVIPIGGDDSIVEAHLVWHRNYARFVEMARNGVSPQDLWPEMQRSRRILQGMVEKRLFGRSPEQVVRGGEEGGSRK
uniref:Diguanylate phosphodiesterase n=1 Tax=Leptospirillum ferrodiazotrophum TaxID=412449 RepID=C6HZI4_9BACT|nr:MAG: diguanylate phosphodiesterase [Leptospirillum ferrodiazotrophum]